MFGLGSWAYLNLSWEDWEYYERIKNLTFCNMVQGECDAS